MNEKLKFINTHISIERKSESSYFLENIDFNAGKLTFTFNTVEDNQTIKLIFSDYYSFRIMEESLLLNYFGLENISKIEFDCIYQVESSPYMNELVNSSENFATQSNKIPKLYGIYLFDDCIEVISTNDPRIEYC
ncbi:hypothetical protein [Moheibacter stercoris]|uniref:Uncharacterized protein n=1 Tax=Moheibacter stercoris TaxID=1628251 RepID=A0ABV2LT07_9FLAO